MACFLARGTFSALRRAAFELTGKLTAGFKEQSLVITHLKLPVTVKFLVVLVYIHVCAREHATYVGRCRVCAQIVCLCAFLPMRVIFLHAGLGCQEKEGSVQA